MWHGKSAISRGTGYSQGRTVRRGGKDSSIRNSNKADSTLGAVSLFGLILFFALILMMIGVI
jgi:hypothetical protein